MFNAAMKQRYLMIDLFSGINPISGHNDGPNTDYSQRPHWMVLSSENLRSQLPLNLLKA
jgi:hypothetical protein